MFNLFDLFKVFEVTIRVPYENTDLCKRTEKILVKYKVKYRKLVHLHASEYFDQEGFPITASYSFRVGAIRKWLIKMAIERDDKVHIVNR